MTTITREFTKEQLIERLLALQERYEWALAAVPEKKDTAIDLQITKIALASLEAEPVPGLFIKCTEIEPCPGKVTITQATPLPDGKYHESCFQLYAAHPTPVSVPDESAVELLATDLMKRIDKITGERHSAATLSSLRVSIVEACRAAMLHGGKS